LEAAKALSRVPVDITLIDQQVATVSSRFFIKLRRQRFRLPPNPALEDAPTSKERGNATHVVKAAVASRLTWLLVHAKNAKSAWLST
jgi:hypothetical protein